MEVARKERVVGSNQIYFVSPNGSDSYDGTSIRWPKATLLAGIEGVDTRGVLNLSADHHVVAEPIDCERKELYIQGPDRPERRYQASNVAYLTTAGGTLQDYLQLNTDAALGNLYGFGFKNLVFDMTKVTRAAVYSENVNFAVVMGCVFRITSGAFQEGKYGIYSVRNVAASGEDAAWWRFDQNFAARVHLAHLEGATNPVFDRNICFGRGVSLNGCASPAFYGNTFESGGTIGSDGAYGVYAENCDGVQANGNKSESLGRKLFVLVDCTNSQVLVTGGAGEYGGHLEIDGGGKHHLLDANRWAEASTAGRIDSALTVQGAGMGSPTIAAAHAFAEIHSEVSTLKRGEVLEWAEPAVELYALRGFAIEYWDGVSWVAWAEVDPDLLVTPTQSVTIDVVHKRFRLRNLTSFSGIVGGQMLCRHGSIPAGSLLINVQYLDASLVLLDEFAFSTADTTNRGFVLATRKLSTCAYLQVEFDFPLTGVQTTTISRLALFIPQPGNTHGGREMRGRRAPESVVEGRIGDEYLDLAGARRYVKRSGNNTTTGWVAYALEGG